MRSCIRWTIWSAWRWPAASIAPARRKTPGAIVDQSVASFRRQLTEQEAAPVIADLHRHFEQHRAEVLAQPGIDAAEATRRLINRLLHSPKLALKAAAPTKDLEAALRRLFGLNDKDQKK